MASSTPLTDLAENFFLCAVCLDQYKEPKQLPCLHRYCRNCLKTVIQASSGGKLKCPLCKQKYVIPENGVDDFKTDFHMNSMLEFIQLQKSFENKDLKKCVSCLKNTEVSAYCFMCRDYLCGQCYKVHVTRKMFADHKAHILKLDKTRTMNMTLDKLASLTEGPKCHVHENKGAQLCCSSCGNVPVCIACRYDKHKGHDLHDVTEIAERERKLLEQELAELTKYKSQLYGLPTKIQTTAEKLHRNAMKTTERLTIQHKQEAYKIKVQLAKYTKERRRGLKDIERRRRVNDGQITLKLEEELSQVRKTYDKIRETANQEYDKESEEFINKYDVTEGQLLRKRGSLDANFKNLKTAKDLRVNQLEDELKRITEYCEQVIKRYENLTAKTSSILASKDDWTDSQCIPDIRAACEPLMEEMKKEYPQLKSLSDLSVPDITKVISDNVIITDHEESVVDVKGFRDKGWCINGIACSGDGNIVITGACEPDKHSHISVINRKGKIQRQDRMERELGFTPYRFCCPLSKFKVVTVCMPDEIGIYDVRNGSYHSQKISDVITSWPAGRLVYCVASDSVQKEIIVGTNSRDLYVFDGQFNYKHTKTLPDVCTASFDITKQGHSLLICDFFGRRAIAVDIARSESRIRYEFTKPDEADWAPLSVCTDKSNFIYMLWQAETSDPVKRVIMAQYSRNGKQLLSTRRLDDDFRCVTTLQMDTPEKLLIATSQLGKLYTYGLVVK